MEDMLIKMFNQLNKEFVLSWNMPVHDYLSYILIQLNHIFTSYFLMNSGVVFMVYSRIWDVPSLNLGWDTHNLHRSLSKFVSDHPST